jgi:hypothetical protein
LVLAAQLALQVTILYFLLSLHLLVVMVVLLVLVLLVLVAQAVVVIAMQQQQEQQEIQGVFHQLKVLLVVMDKELARSTAVAVEVLVQ